VDPGGFGSPVAPHLADLFDTPFVVPDGTVIRSYGGEELVEPLVDR
jgi:hypothetical protein